MSEKAKLYIKIIVVLVIAWVVFFGKSTYLGFINDKAITKEDIIGTYSYNHSDTVTFNADGSITGFDYLHGKWEIYDADNQRVKINLYATDQDAIDYSNFVYEMTGEYCLYTKDEVLEDYGQNHRSFENKNFKYLRSEGQLFSIEDGDGYTAFDGESTEYTNDYMFYKKQ